MGAFTEGGEGRTVFHSRKPGLVAATLLLGFSLNLASPSWGFDDVLRSFQLEGSYLRLSDAISLIKGEEGFGVSLEVLLGFGLLLSLLFARGRSGLR